MIIVEGGDNVGKSTLVDKLLRADPMLQLRKRKRYKVGLEETIGTSYFRALLPEDGDRTTHGYGVIDRLVASECIYGPLFRNGCRLTLAEHIMLEQLLVSYGTIVIWCDVPDAVIRKTWPEREQLYDDALRIAASYRQRIERVFQPFPVLRYDWTEADPTFIPHALATHRGRQSTQLAWWSAMPFGVGQLEHPEIMFIGEQLGPRAALPIPFVSGPSGEFFAETLTYLFRAWPDLRTKTYITNAHKHKPIPDSVLLRAELNALHPLIVVPLGKLALELIERVGTTAQVIPMPHPQFWRRFHWNDRLTYVERLFTELRIYLGTPVAGLDPVPDLFHEEAAA